MYSIIDKIKSVFQFTKINIAEPQLQLYGEFENMLLKSKYRALIFIILYTLVVVNLFIILAFLNNNIPIIILNIASSITLIILYIYLRKTADTKITSHIIVNVIAVHYLYLIYSGGMQNMGFIWTFLFPLGVIFFLGKKQGIIYSSIFLLFAAVLLFTASIYKEQGLEFQIRYIGIYITFTIFAYAFENIRTKMNDSLVTSNKLLKKNIEDLHEKDKALTIAKEKAERAERVKSEFLAQMSHEIRTPINTILNYASLLENEFKNKLSEDLLHSFDSINNASARLIRTIDLILDLSAIESGALELHIKKIDLVSDILEPIIKEFKASAQKKKLEFIFQNRLNGYKFVRADIYTITQTVTNLLHNAIKYTETGRITVSCYRDNKSICLEMKDTGIGISDEYLPNLFEKFTQETQGYTRSYEGNGLGLALVKKYCDLNDIKIEVTSKKNVGTAFTLRFINNHLDN